MAGEIFGQLTQAAASISAGQTDASVIPAIAGKAIRVLALFCQAGGTATTLVFNSKGSGSGTAISTTFQNGANGGAVLPRCDLGWFQTNPGEALTATTGAGSTTGIQIIAEYV